MYLLALLVLTPIAFPFLYTPKEFLPLDVTDSLYESVDYSLSLETTCNQISLKSGDYDYNGTVMTGYGKVGKNGSALGYIFYGKEGVSKADLGKVPIVLWLNGGPGSTSQLGNFMELGPFWLKQAPMRPYNIIRNNHSWTKDYSVVFVDQPVGTGLSYADSNTSYCKSMQQVANDFYIFLSEIYKNPNGCFAQLNFKYDQDLIIFGESYAGKYAPAIGQKILRQMKHNNGFLTGLRGVAIGDGFTHPYDTLSMMGEYAYNLGLLDYQERTKVEQMLLDATYTNMNRHWKQLHGSFSKILNFIVNATGGVNVYDITSYYDYPTAILDEYFSNPDVISLYKLNTGVKFNAQRANVYQALYDDFMKPYTGLVEDLLNLYSLPVLIYTGQNDLIVDTPGTFRWVQRLHYLHGEQFRQTLLTPWKFEDKVAGFYKRVGALELKTVNNAGHLVPMDVGAASRFMLREFVSRIIKADPQILEPSQDSTTQ